jgi:hypothetical protein
MNYLKVYCNLIRKAENRTSPEGYTEKHHTFPVSIYGKNNRIVILTSKEHYIAHILLEKIFIKRNGLNHRKSKKMISAHINMKGKNRYFNSRLYDCSRKKRSENMKGSGNSFYGKTHSEDTLIKMREKRSMQKIINTEESNLKRSLATKGILKSEDTKIKMKNNHSRYWKGRKSWNHGTFWWNDGKNNKMSKECPGDGWSRGIVKNK